MVTREDAVAAKVVLRSQIGRPAWLRGVGIGLGADGYFVKVNVSSVGDVEPPLPTKIDRVRVVVGPVGDIEALKG